MKTFQQTERTTLKRLPARGVYDRELVYQILDEGSYVMLALRLQAVLS